MRWGRGITVTVLALGVPACSLVISTDGLTGGADATDASQEATIEAATNDGAIVPDAAAADVVVADVVDAAEAGPILARGTPGVRCDGLQCPSGQGCCEVYAVSPDFCVSNASSCVSDAGLTFDLTCDDAADCPDGTVCCAVTNGPSGIFSSTTCKAQCLASEKTLCTRDDQCPASKSCQSLFDPNGYEKSCR